MTTYYIRDRRTGGIVNAVESSSPKAEVEERVLSRMVDGDHLYLDANPPMSVLQRYRYWNERP